MVKDPDSGKRLSRLNPRSEWQSHAAEHLRIVPPLLFAAVNNRKAYVGSEVPQRKNTRILSGLLRCGVCGAGMSIKGKMGRATRIMCTRAKEAKACSNTRPYTLDHIETTVLDGLRSRLKDERLMDHFVACYNDEHHQLYSGQGAAREKAAQRLAAAIREFDRILNMAVKEMISDAEAARLLPELRAEKARLEAELSVIPEPPKVVYLKPALVGRYIRGMEQLDAVVRENGDITEEAKKLVRDLIMTVTVYPPKSGERPEIRIDGRLSPVVDEALSQRLAIRGGTVVEGRALKTKLLRFSAP